MSTKTFKEYFSYDYNLILYRAVEEYDYVKCEKLFKNGINPNSMYDEYTILYWVFHFYNNTTNKKIKETYIDIINLFHRYGVDFNQPIDYYNSKCMVYGFIPLISIFAVTGSIENIKLLVKIPDADINFINRDGSTPLFYAIKCKQYEVIELLIKNKKVNVNYVNQEGFTPLLYSAKFGDIDVVKILLKNTDININFINKDGYTPLMFAAKYGRFEVVKLLTKDKRIDLFITNKDLTAGDYARIKFFRTKDIVYENINKYLFELLHKQITKMLNKYDGKRKY